MEVRYDSKSFKLDGQRIFIIGGEIHYFRIPRKTWYDRLLKSKQAGINTVSTYVPWNYHEPEEGIFEFDGEKDLGNFLSLCEELGFYVVIRPGPYICSEWDMGGLPAWLIPKRGIRFRCSNPVYLSYIDKWFDRLIPLLAKHQITQDGTIILAQIENEYGNFQERQDVHYLEYLRDCLVKRGIQVPLITCDGYIFKHVIPSKVKGVIMGINMGGIGYPYDVEKNFEERRKKQPQTPIMIPEFWNEEVFDGWGDKRLHLKMKARHVEHLTKETLAYGGTGFDSYMWSGGTNFGYWNGRSINSPYNFITTSYDLDAPISETGILKPKYYACKRLYHFIETFTELLTAADAGDASQIKTSRGIRKVLRETRMGRLLFLFNDNARMVYPSVYIKGAKVRFPKFVAWAMRAKEIASVVIDYRLDNFVKINYSATNILKIHKLWHGKRRTIYVMVYGEPKKIGEIEFKINKRPEFILNEGKADYRWNAKKGLFTVMFNYPVGQTISDFIFRNQKRVYHVIVVNTKLAERTWFIKDLIIIGPDFVSKCEITNKRLCLDAYYKETRKTSIYGAGFLKISKPLYVDNAVGKISLRPKIRKNKDRIIKLSNWQYREDFLEKEIDFNDNNWLEINTPQDMAHLGCYWGYGWYRNIFYTIKAEDTFLYFAGASDRLIIFLNSRLVGTIGAWAKEQYKIPVRVKKGENILAILADNLGRQNAGAELGLKLNEPKGLYAPVCIGGWKRKLVNNWRFRAGISKEQDDWTILKERAWCPITKLSAYKKTIRFFKTAFTLSKDDIEDLNPWVVIMEGMHKGVFWLNGHHLGRYWDIGPQKEYYLPEAWLKSNNKLLLFDESGRSPQKIYIASRQVNCRYHSTRQAV